MTDGTFYLLLTKTITVFEITCRLFPLMEPSFPVDIAVADAHLGGEVDEAGGDVDASRGEGQQGRPAHLHQPTQLTLFHSSPIVGCFSMLTRLDG